MPETDLEAELDRSTEATFGLTEEGGGVVATCKRCGWLRWLETRPQALSAGREHKCRAKGRKKGRR